METVTRLLADTEWHEAVGMPYGGTYTGADAIFSNVFGPLSQDVEGFVVKPDEILDVGDKVISLGRYEGRGGNGPVDSKFAHVWTIRDGTIVRFDQHADTKVFSDAVGK
jgi:hypothetical protein